MPLVLRLASRADAGRIAEIHMAAFGSNAMLRAQFPTPAVRDSLRSSVEAKALADIDDPNTTVLVVWDSHQTDQDDLPGKGQDEVESRADGRVVAFAKWAHPVADDAGYVEPSWVWPEGTDWKVLEDWTRKTEEAQERAVGRVPCYRLHFIGTDPSYERRGAASLMLHWGIEQCKSSQTLAYLESTVEAAPFYRKYGFVDAERFALKLEGSSETKVYEEISFIFNPSL